MESGKLSKSLDQVNENLKVIEKNIVTMSKRIDADLQKQVIDATNPMYDYELEVQIYFYSKLDEENVLCELHESLKFISSHPNSTNIDNGVNHSEFQHWENHIMKKEHHCWLYHCLYDHENLSWEQIESINQIYWDIRPYHQYKHIINTQEGRA